MLTRALTLIWASLQAASAAPCAQGKLRPRAVGAACPALRDSACLCAAAQVPLSPLPRALQDQPWGILSLPSCWGRRPSLLEPWTLPRACVAEMLGWAAVLVWAFFLPPAGSPAFCPDRPPPRPSTHGEIGTGRPPLLHRQFRHRALLTCGSRPLHWCKLLDTACCESICPRACRARLGVPPPPCCWFPSGAGGQPSSLSPPSPVLGQRCPGGPLGHLPLPPLGHTQQAAPLQSLPPSSLP